MKGKINLYVDLLILLSAIGITLGFINLSKGLTKAENTDKDSIVRAKADTNVVQLTKEEVDINEVISNLTKDKYVIRQEDLSSKYLSIVMTDSDNAHSSFIVNKRTGEARDFISSLNKSDVEDFWNKVYELLYKKYPTFIVDTIKNSEGTYYFDIFPNEVVIYFENYVFKPEITSIISIKVNYNEIDSMLDFSHQLDEEYENEDGFKYDPNKKTIAFSFDDGPSGDKTKSIVDALINNKAHATFFMVGNKMYNYKEQLLYVYNNGLEIGQHTYSHINLSKTSMDKIKEEINKTAKNYNDITGDKIKLFRPPYGAYSKDIMSKIDYPFILWSVDTNDWKYKDKDRTVNYILDNAYDGCIVLMHDSYEATVEAVKEVLPLLYAKGYQVVGVSELASLKGKTLSSNNSYRKF